jgi:hypothetical protein
VRNDGVPETAAPVGLSLVRDQDPMAPMIDDDTNSTCSSTSPSQKEQQEKKRDPCQQPGGCCMVEWSVKKD